MRTMLASKVRAISALVLLGLLLPGVALAPPPAWWVERGAINPARPADDYAAANVGQLKQMAAKAAAELNARLPGGGGTTINALVAGWAQPAAVGVTRDDLAAVNLGQLKTIAKPFYDQFIANQYTDRYPWTASSTPPNDFALANLGQIKNVFAFDLTAPGAGLDLDHNGLPDWWEIQHFGHTGVNPSADPDGDGLSNLQEFQQGFDPIDFYNGRIPLITKTSGDGQDGYLVSGLTVAPVVLTPIEVKVTNAITGASFSNVSVRFSPTGSYGVQVAQSGGSGASWKQEITVSTDSTGYASAWVKMPTGIPPVDQVVEASADPANPTRFVIHVPDGLDSDGNGLADAWEMSHFGTLGHDPGGDDDLDGLSNAEEQDIGSDPINPDTDGDGKLDGNDCCATFAGISEPRVPNSHFAIIDLGADRGPLKANSRGQVIVLNSTSYWENGVWSTFAEPFDDLTESGGILTSRPIQWNGSNTTCPVYRTSFGASVQTYLHDGQLMVTSGANTSINTAGVLTQGYFTVGFPSGESAMLGGVTSGYPMDLNDSRQIVGFTTTAVYEPFTLHHPPAYWASPSADETVLPAGGSDGVAACINNKGFIVGSGSGGNSLWYRKGDAYMRYALSITPGFNSLNDRLEIISADGKLWRNDRVFEIKDLLEENSSYTAFTPYSISNNGTITASAMHIATGPDDPVPAGVRNALLLPFELNSDLNNDGKVGEGSDSSLKSAGAEDSASAEAKERATEYLFVNDQLSNGAWDKEQSDPNKPASAVNDDDAEELKTICAATWGAVWFEYESGDISKFAFYKSKECKPADKVTFPFALSETTKLPEKLFVRAEPENGWTNQDEGKLVMKFGKADKSETYATNKLRFTVVKEIGNTKYFHAARDYMLEQNTRLHVRYFKSGSHEIRITAMRYESTDMKVIETFYRNPKIYGMPDVVAKSQDYYDLLVNGNFCFFGNVAQNALGMATHQMTLHCHGGCVVGGAQNPATSVGGTHSFEQANAEYLGAKGKGTFEITTGVVPLNPVVHQAALGGFASNLVGGGYNIHPWFGLAEIGATNDKKKLIFTVTQTAATTQYPVADLVARLTASGQTLCVAGDGGSSTACAHRIEGDSTRVKFAGDKHYPGHYWINTYVGFKSDKPRP